MLFHSNSPPGEVILDEAKKDVQTIVACLRVCTAWHSLICALYHSMQIQSSTQLNKLAHAARTYRAVRACFASVRAITLGTLTLLPHRYRVETLHPLPPNLNSQVFPLVLGRHFRSVEHLHFFNCLHRPFHSSFFTLLPRLEKVKQLVVFHANLGNLPELQRIICAFPLLEELHLESLDVYNGNDQSVFHARWPPKVTLLRISNIHYGLLRNLGRWMDMSSIHTLDLQGDSMCSGVEVDSHCVIDFFLTPAASTLVCLHMADWRDSSEETRENGLPIYSRSFEQFAHLRTLDITPNRNRTRDIIRRLLGLLSHIARPMLEVIRLHLELTDGLHKVATADWADASRDGLHAVLTSTVFDPLASITVILNTSAWMRILAKETNHEALGNLMSLRELFAPWLARGIVRQLVVGIYSDYDARYTALVAKGDEDPFWVHGKGEI